MLDPLLSICPLDGRYRSRVAHLEQYFSEYALIRYRLFVELEWFIFMCNEIKLPGTRVLTTQELRILREFSTLFDVTDGNRVKEFEKKTNHDVKALEYFIKEHFKAYPKLLALSEFIHFGCTSEDINNTAYNLLLKDFCNKELKPLLTAVSMALFDVGKRYKQIPMLSHTHGQPASPTTIGKELINVVARLQHQYKQFAAVQFTAKWSGAVGNFNAHVVAYPNLDWAGISVRFLSYLGLTPHPYTTQIEPHDSFGELCHATSRINTILLDFCRDMWLYISRGYFSQKLKEGEVGSSTMPHKVNPIDFENAEGNFGLSNALLTHFAEKLPVSRLQRDLSDSTVVRNFGTAFGYCVLSIKSILTGLQKVTVNEVQLLEDLENNWEVLAEAVQTVLRRHKIPGAYETLKELTHGRKLDKRSYSAFIKTLKIPVADKKRLLALTPATYTGLAAQLADSFTLKF